jgi:hypothetical protein
MRPQRARRVGDPPRLRDRAPDAVPDDTTALLIGNLFGAPSRDRGNNGYASPEQHMRPIPSVRVDERSTVTRMRNTVSGKDQEGNDSLIHGFSRRQRVLV